jgi:archaemetzincin
MSEIILAPLHFSNIALLEFLRYSIPEITGFPTIIENHSIDLAAYYDANRGQYDAIKIIREFEKENSPHTLILTTVDLFIPIFTFVFGLAKLNGRMGIVSTHRLENRYYGLPDDPELLQERLIKEVIHEFGHLVGLRHCPQFDCVMASSTSADEIDIKTAYYCEACRRRFEENFAGKR